MDFVIVIGFLVAASTALASLEIKERIQSLVLLLISTAAIGFLFIYVGAIYVGVFQLLVYSGVMTVLFAATSYFLESHPTQEGDIGTIEVNMSE